jgi:hypothetical protein
VSKRICVREVKETGSDDRIPMKVKKKRGNEN